MGSAGDVHPLVGLGEALAARGHQVTVLTNAYFQSLIERVGLGYAELSTEEEFHRLANHPDLWHPRKAFFYIARHGIHRFMRRQYELIAELVVPNQTVVVNSCLGFGARIAHDKLGLPLITVHLQPAALWSTYRSPKLYGLATADGIPRWLKRFQYWLGETILLDPSLCGETNKFRAELGLPPVRNITSRWWHSPQCVLGMFPGWYAPPQPDWPPNTVLSGFPLWDERGVSQVPTEVNNFIEDGDPPIVFTPGSAMMFGREFFKSAADACRMLRRRAILLTRFGEQIPSGLPEGVRHVDYIPFSQVLPRAAALVHHGGIGSTAQALAAGIPQLVMPMAHDQPDNAARVKRLGVGTWIKPSAFRGRNVARQLEYLLGSTEVASSCRQTAARFDGADPLAKACDVVERAGLS